MPDEPSDAVDPKKLRVIQETTPAITAPHVPPEVADAARARFLETWPEAQKLMPLDTARALAQAVLDLHGRGTTYVVAERRLVEMARAILGT